MMGWWWEARRPRPSDSPVWGRQYLEGKEHRENAEGEFFVREASPEEKSPTGEKKKGKESYSSGKLFR